MKMKMPYRNRNHTGWWVASYIERFEFYDEKKRNLNRRCVAWENTILIRAKNREQAFRKAIAIGKISQGSEGWDNKGRKGVWRFEGLTSLLPVYDKIDDGSEIFWKEYEGRTVGKIKSWIKHKKELEAFDDSPIPRTNIYH